MESGVMSTHEEFDGRVIRTMDYTRRGSEDLPENCLESNNPTCAMDINGQGTHVAGTIAARNYGVAPEATVYALKVGENWTGQTSWLDEALDYVSHETYLGVKRPAVLYIGFHPDEYSDAIRDAIEECVSRGVVVLTESGSREEPINAALVQPANMPSVITVGSTGNFDENWNFFPDALSWYSNFGPSVDIWAPGIDIYTTHIWNDKAIGWYDGTCQAAAHAVGVAALILELKPHKNTSEIREDMISAALPGVITGFENNESNLLLQVPVQGLGSTRPDA